MWCHYFVIILLEAAFVYSVYFSMADIKLNLLSDKSKFPPGDHTIISLNALKENKFQKRQNVQQEHFRYSLRSNKEGFLHVSPTSGEIMFTKAFFENVKDIRNITAVAIAEDNMNKKTSTTVEILISTLTPLECDQIIPDLCYYQSVSYRIFENQRPSTLGSLNSRYIAEMCPGYKIDYNLIKGGNQFGLVPPTTSDKSWQIRTLQPLDRDVNRAKKSSHSGEFRNISIMCTVEDGMGTIRQVPKDISIQILDQDDNPPQPQSMNRVEFTLQSDLVKKGEILEHKELIFIDRDSPPVNHFDIRVVNDVLGILEPHYITYEDDREGESQTAIHCTLNFAKDAVINNTPYAVSLLINDTSLLPGFGNSSVELPIQLHFLYHLDKTQSYGTSNVLGELKNRNILYLNKDVKIFRTAAPLARVNQPDKHKFKENMKNFHFRAGFENKGFEVTANEGIIFIHDSSLIKNRSVISLQIEWTNEEMVESDEILINVIDEPTHTCDKIGDSVKNWKFCAENKNPKSCAKTCGLSTGGFPSVQKRKSSGLERCMWRGDRNPGNNTTHLYATCSPDVETCPDGICDALEQLHPLICPQDCSEKITFPMQLNKKTRRGFEIGEGVCSCTHTGDCTCEYPETKRKKNKKTSASEDSVDLVISDATSASYTNTSTETAGEKMRCGTTCIIGIGGAFLFLIVIVSTMVCRWKSVKKQKKKKGVESGDSGMPLSNYLHQNGIDHLQLSFDMTSSLTNHQLRTQLKPDPKWEFPRNQLNIERTLGEGEFGRVLRAQALNIGGQGGGTTTVAVKTLKDDAGERELADLLSEYELLKQVTHPNVIKLLGASTTPEGPIYLIIEFAELGSLRSYLRRSRHLQPESRMQSFRIRDVDQEHYDEPKVCEVTPKDILSFAWQITNGMDYLTQIKLVHRDLAARNILLATDKVCKISDFGLTRDVYEDEAYFKKTKGRLPVKWMAPESLSDHVYTTKSDVWSFGILLWELITLGASPYPGVSIQSLFHLLRTGYRMEKPENCSVELYKVMKSCWLAEPESRPTFAVLSSKFEKMLKDEVQYLEFTSNSIYNRGYLWDDEEEGTNVLDKKSVKNAATSPTNSSLNYLENVKNYMKCGEADKLLVATNEDIDTTKEENCPILRNEGYETPIKVKNSNSQTTPINETPHNGYTDMSPRNSK